MSYVMFSQYVSIFTSNVTCANNVRNKNKNGGHVHNVVCCLHKTEHEC